MKKSIIALLSATILLSGTIVYAQEVQKRTQGQLVMENVPIAPQEIKDRLLQYQNTRAAGFAGFTKDGILISTRFGETSQIHSVNAPLGARNQLTYYPEQIGGASMRPKHDGFVFSKDKGGDEFFQYYYFDLKTGKATQLTEAGTRNESLEFSQDGKLMAWSVSRSGSPVREIMMMEIDNPASKKLIFKKEGGWSVLAFAPDNKSLLLGEYISVTKSTRAILDITSGALTPITPELSVSYDGGEFTQDGKSLILISDEDSDFSYGVKIDLKTQKRTAITPKVNWDIDSISLSPDGKNIAYSTNENGISNLYTSSLANSANIHKVKLPIGVLGGARWNEQSNKLGLSISTATAPTDAFVYDLTQKRLVRWTKSEIGGLNASDFVDPKLVQYPTFDNDGNKKRTIPAFIYEPKTKGPHPVIIQIHGGPEGQSRPNFSSTINYWVNELGIAVIVPNVRGSTGYGKKYVDLDNGYKRMDSVNDIGALIDWIGQQKQYDKDKIIVYGGSYGGFMTLAAITNFNDKLAGAVDIVGISNFVTFLENTQGYRRDLRRVEYGDERDPKMRAFQQEIAPLNNAQKITKPLFVIQGANDPRVPQSEAEQMVAKVRTNGGKVWYMLGLDEGHGFAKKSNRDAQREAETMFLKEVFKK
jgi:dipeptidyl aminopeptidase/acylaminoacyl peptidase